jgi:hypothetical protein
MTRNRIKHTASQATTIEPEVFKDHYARNWEDSPEELNIEDYSDFIMQRKLVFVESDMLRELLNKKKMQEAISKKVNLSAPGLDKLTYPILKFEKEDVTNLMVSIMEMLLRMQRYPESWKEGKVVM